MSQTTLTELLERNRAHVRGTPEDHLADVQDGQRPAVVSITCSDSRVSQEGMFSVDEPGWLFAPSSIGNQVADVHEGRRVIDGSLLYPIQHTGTRTVAVVGHTGCGAVTAALASVRGEGGDLAPGVRKEVELIEPIVEDALKKGTVDASVDDETLVNQLVEVNVREQVRILLESPQVSDEVDVYGFVYDLTGAYGGPEGRTYLVDANGEQDPQRLREGLPDEWADHVDSLLG